MPRTEKECKYRAWRLVHQICLHCAQTVVSGTSPCMAVRQKHDRVKHCVVTCETYDIGDCTEFIDADAEMCGLEGYRG